jgi:predicted ester cyclase
MPEDEIRKAREAVVLAHMDSEDRHAFEETIETFSHPRYEVVPTDEVFDGAEALRGFYEETHVAFPDFHFGEPLIHHTDDTVIVEVDFIGTHLGPYRGLPATGRKLRYRMCNLFVFEGTDLVCERLHFDRLTILIQLGIARDPTTAMGRLVTAFNHPLTLLKALLRPKKAG